MKKTEALEFLESNYQMPWNEDVLIYRTNNKNHSLKDLLKIAYDLEDKGEQREQHIFDVFNDAIQSHIREHSKDPVALIISPDLMFDYKLAVSDFTVGPCKYDEPNCMKYEGINVIALWGMEGIKTV